MDPSSKLAKVREAMAAEDWDLAIRLAARFRSLGEYSEAIRRGKEILERPDFYRELGSDVDEIKRKAIQALKEKYSKSWEESQKRAKPKSR